MLKRQYKKNCQYSQWNVIMITLLTLLERIEEIDLPQNLPDDFLNTVILSQQDIGGHSFLEVLISI